MFTKRFLNISVIFLFLFNFNLSLVLADVWEAPPANPPNGNRSRPIDVSADAQTKAGDLYIQGNVGIGTIIPEQTLEVRDNTIGVARLRITDTVQNPELQLKYGDGANDHWSLYVDNANDNLRIWNSSDRLVIDNNGNVGIGIATPLKKLDVSGVSRLAGSIQVGNNGSIKEYNNLASYTSSSDTAGAFVIQTNIPMDSNTMTVVTIKGYFYDNTAPFHIEIGGYYRSAGDFLRRGYINIGNFRPTVRFARNILTGKVAIILGDEGSAYSYPKLSVTHALAAYSTLDNNYGENWTISQQTNLSGFDYLNTVPDVTAAGGSNLWSDMGTYIKAANIGGTSGLEIYDAEYGGVKLVNNNLQLHNNSLIYQTTDAGSSPVLIDDQLMIGRRYSNPDCGHYCDNGLDMLNGENLIFGRVRQTTTGNNDATQNLLRLQRGDGTDAQIDKLVVDLDGNANLAGTLAVGSNNDPYSNLAIWTNKDAADGSSLDDFALLIQNPADDDFEEVGIGFRISNTHNNTSYPGAAITFERIGDNSQGKLRFKTFNNNTNDFSTRMVINQIGNVSIGFTDPNLQPSYVLDVEGEIRAKEKSDGSLGNLRADNDLIIGGTGNFDGNVYFGGGYGNSGISLENSGNGWFNGLLTVDSAFYVGGGYGNTGLTVDSQGNFGTNGMSQFGSNSLNVASGQNLIYGNIDAASAGNLMLLQNEGNDKFIIKADGKVGIGDSTPDSILSVYGGVSIDNDNTVPSVSSGDLTIWDGLLKVCDSDNCSNSYATGDGDVYVEDDLEVDGDIILSGSINKSDGDSVIEFSSGNVIIHLGQ